MIFKGQEQEVKELQNFLQSALQINGSMIRLGLDVEDMSIHIPFVDWEYLVRIIEQNTNGKHYKFYKNVNDKCFKIGNIKIVGD